ncbi:hypothetical protein FRUB_05123 [Fimbriiglobus ruber]|uniref:Uncharacterized protein n=1 Tax=Fimbriiglobus ruber TaxID=1908690 RepID=A0A225DLQ7_9BACT|nr:hypothetical protein FRUB_09735 [Fimbriiglobus ruber]OWK37375.1 hypothetical protein FRUB_06495 [Fimbriiglobus ruber]OWK40204.1 hypothetical protein FRUB_05123 [Fimbriiglobus ruber]
MGAHRSELAGRVGRRGVAGVAAGARAGVAPRSPPEGLATGGPRTGSLSDMGCLRGRGAGRTTRPAPEGPRVRS